MSFEQQVLMMLENIQDDVSEMKARMDNVESKLSVVESDLSTLKSEVSALKSDVSDLKSDVSTIKSQLDENTQITRAVRYSQEEVSAGAKSSEMNRAILDGLGIQVSKHQGLITEISELMQKAI